MVKNPSWQEAHQSGIYKASITNEFTSALPRMRNVDFSLLKYLFYCLIRNSGTAACLAGGQSGA